MSPLPERLLRNAMSEPSGEYSGSVLTKAPFEVCWRKSLRSRFADTMSVLPNWSDTHAMRLPSGDQVGCSSVPERTVKRTSFEPSAFMT